MCPRPPQPTKPPPVMFMKNGDPVYALFVIIGENAFCQGTFLTEADAVDNCKLGEAVALVRMGQRFPYDISEVEKFYFPHHEKWEASPLYLRQQVAAKIVSKFLPQK
jgi:hypothetical protein